MTAVVPGLVGVVLAAGSGVRAGGPKGLRVGGDGRPWLVTAVSVLRDAGCSRLLVVTGAWAAAVAALVPDDAEPVDCPEWNTGLAATFRTGLSAAANDPPGATPATAVLFTLVDLPGMPAAVAQRVVAAGPVDTHTLRRATVDGRPTHPVLLGREHWAGAAELANGERGAGPYLRRNGAQLVDVGDLWDGADVDGPEVDGPEVDGPDVDGPEVDGPDVDGPDVDGPEVDGPDA
jgi:CTP:molybdopterin cytidylyltransferase MocA